MSEPKTLFEKLWDAHVIATADDGASLLYIDRHLIHDGSRNAFELVNFKGLPVRRPAQAMAVADHLVPTVNQHLGIPGIQNPEARSMAQIQVENCKKHGIRLYGLGDRRQGIVHVVGPEQGFTQPGLTIVCGDSHTSTHGAFGALAFGIGSSEVAHVLASQTLWQQKAKTMKIHVDGELSTGVTGKDIILHVIGEIGTGGATQHVMEFCGSGIEALSMEDRMSICNMSIEAGARAGMIAPDAKTYAYLEGRPFSPPADQWDRAVEYWSSFCSDAGASYDRTLELKGAEILPTVTWGTSPEDAVAITGRVPDPTIFDPSKRARVEKALKYMDLRPGTAMEDIAIDKVFIGSCTNARIEDLRVAAAIAKGRKAVVSTMVVPGSGLVKRQAEAEGLDKIFIEANFEWRDPGCSMCLGMNDDQLGAGQRCASTSNRNFEGRQGRGSRTHLMSPAMAAAAAVTGHLVDVRTLL